MVEPLTSPRELPLDRELTIHSLSDELIHIIFEKVGYSDPRQVSTLCLVCKRWYRVGSSDYLWMRLASLHWPSEPVSSERSECQERIKRGREFQDNLSKGSGRVDRYGVNQPGENFHITCALLANSGGKSYLVAGGSEGAVWFWTPLNHPEEGPIAGRMHVLRVLNLLAISILGEDRVLSSGLDPYFCLWDPVEQRCMRQFRGHGDYVYSLKLLFCEEGSTPKVASLSRDGTVRIWNVLSGECLALYDQGSWVSGLVEVQTQSGRVMATSSRQGTLHFWRIDPEGEERRCRRSQWPTQVSESAICKLLPVQEDGKRILAGMRDGEIHLLGDEAKCERMFLSHKEAVDHLKLFSLGGRQYLASGDRAGKLCVWDLELGELRFSAPKAHERKITGLEVIEVGYGIPLIVTVGGDGYLCLWNMQCQERFLRWRQHEGMIYSLRVVEWEGLPVLLTASEDGTVCVWNFGKRPSLLDKFRNLLEGTRPQVSSPLLIRCAPAID